MEQERDGRIGRRTLLQWGVAGVVVAGLSAGTQSVAFAAPPSPASGPLSLGPTPGGLTSILVPGASQAVEVPYDLGVTISGGAAGLAGGSVLTFQFDPLLYDLTPQVTATSGTGTLPAAGQPATTDTRTGLTTATVTLNDAVPPGGTATVIVGHLRPRRYPYDIVRGFKQSEAAVTDHRTKERRSRGLSGRAAAPVNEQPWGFEAGVLWQPIAWGSGFRSYCAREASVHSTGPGPVPAGYRVRVMADPAVVRSVRVLGAFDGAAVAGSAADLALPGVRGVEWTAKSPLAAGRRVRLQLAVTVAAPGGDLKSIKHPMVELIGPEAHRGAQRTTYLESVIRDDSIYDAETKARFA
ncbi:hypothetical protein [Parafrankia sp. EUN1f]|uniref:hypothetical protein n=1 Tax=Parafrankia sp. EUN1f TaxID=102897 RepID=UPI0001C47422|nr:hypothetical protein [Parafrankia sp. EUN1f]EFC86326.1 hypothetical protein FrEUN1fDRAFT_0596 [Parafrankia sp. EUN1f]